MAGGGISNNRLVDLQPSIVTGAGYKPVNILEAATLNRDAVRVFGAEFGTLTAEQQRQIFLGWFDIPGQRIT